MKSTFSVLFTEQDAQRECEDVAQELLQLGVTKPRQIQSAQKRVTDRVNLWIQEELVRHETVASRAQASTAIDGTSEYGTSAEAGASRKFEKLLDYV